MLPPVTRPTRITKTSATLIDNIIVSMNYVGRYSCNVLIDNISDHLPSILLLSGVMAHRKEPVLIKSRDLRKCNVDKSGVIDHITVNGVTDYTANGIGKAFSNFFSNVGKCYAEKIPKSKKHVDDYLTAIRRNKSSFFLTPTSTTEITKLLEGLPNKCSSSHDNVSNLLLKELVKQISPILEVLFNESLTTGQFPDKMKIADIVPLYKSKEHDIVDNYRPISLLLTIS